MLLDALREAANMGARIRLGVVVPFKGTVSVEKKRKTFRIKVRKK